MGNKQNQVNMSDVKKRTLFEKEGYDCGCLALPVKELQGKQPTELPLKKIVYDIALVSGVAEVTLYQVYVNRGEKLLELQYRFPVHPNACIHKFVATFSKLRMEGVVKEKEVARVEYSEAVKAGKRAALGEVDPDSKDILTLQLGNLGPGEEVTIELHYVEELSISLNTFYQFTFVPRLTPRYVNSIPHNDILSAFRNSVKTVGGDFEWDFRLSLRTARKITSFKSPTHALVTEKSDDLGTEYAFTLGKGESMNKAFSFLFSTQDFALPSYTIGRTDSGSSVIVSFIPKFCTLDLKDAELAAVNAQSFETDMDGVRGEYIFVLDRSGSMSGKPIEKAKEALILFLKSLPIDTYFQVVSFGSGYQNMFAQSQKNGNESVAKALQKIAPIQADMGGTEIYVPLEKILKSEIIKGYPRQIFLLTDGEVSDTERVIELVRKNSKYSRVHTIGFGSGVSKALILGCAQKGRGGHVFIGDDEDPSSKIIQLLNESLTPVISEVSLTYDKEVVESIVPNPAKLPFILKGDIANFFITFKGQLSQATSISLSYTDSLNGLPFKSTIQVSPQSPSEVCVDKMANFRRIRALEEAETANGDVQDYVYFVKEVNRKQEIIALSTKHQVLSKHTAFICVETELVDGRYQQIKSKGKDTVQIVDVFKPIEYQNYSRSIRSYSLSSAPMASAPVYRSIIPSQPMDEEMCCEQYQNECDEGEMDYADFPDQHEQKNMLLECYLQAEEVEEEACVVFSNQCNEEASIPKPVVEFFSVKEVIRQQQFEGFWDSIDIVKQLYGGVAVNDVNNLSPEDRRAAITFLITTWMEKHHPEKEYTLIVRKAKNWLKKQKIANELPTILVAHIK